MRLQQSVRLVFLCAHTTAAILRLLFRRLHKAGSRQQKVWAPTSGSRQWCPACPCTPPRSWGRTAAPGGSTSHSAPPASCRVCGASLWTDLHAAYQCVTGLEGHLLSSGICAGAACQVCHQRAAMGDLKLHPLTISFAVLLLNQCSKCFPCRIQDC